MAASNLVKEASFLSRLKHRNIVDFLGVSETLLSAAWEDDHGYFFVMDVLESTLKVRLKDLRKSRHTTVMSRFRRQSKMDIDSMLGRLETVALGVARAMEYLHDQDIVLQDLKPENIGFDMNGEVRLFDFGMAYELGDGSVTRTCGTPRYLAPEIWCGENTSKASDIFSFGIVLYEICTLRIPFSKARSIVQIKQMILSGKRPSLKGIGNRWIESLISDCWSHNPDHRPTFYNIRVRLTEILREDNDWENGKKWESSISTTISSSSLSTLGLLMKNDDDSGYLSN